MKILAVDDDSLMLDFLKTAMASAGFGDVTLATSAVEAAQIIAETTPQFDCMFIDFKMPEIDGDYLCSWVRHLPNYSSTPLIMTTALSDKPDIDRAFAAGASDYITKPVDLNDLLSRIRKISSYIHRENLLAKNSTAETVRKVGSVSTRSDFSNPQRIRFGNREIAFEALENYVVQLSLDKIQNISAFSFAINDAAKLHFVCSKEEYTDILKKVGQAIVASVGTPHYFLSYAGYGAFVGVIDSDIYEILSRSDLESKIHFLLNDLTIRGPGSPPIRVETFMSSPHQLGSWSGPKTADVLFRVIGEAEERCRDMREVASTNQGATSIF